MSVLSALICLMFGAAEVAHKGRDPHTHDDHGKGKLKAALCRTQGKKEQNVCHI